MRLYFNPNWNPEQYYPAIKPLAILYDQIWLWSPSLDDVEEHLRESPMALFGSIDPHTKKPILLPAGREDWFNYPGGAPQASKAKLERIATTFGGVLDSDYKPGYDAVESVWNDDTLRTRLLHIASEAMPHFSPTKLSDIQSVADERKRPIEWGVANAYVQDYMAIRKLGSPYPLMSTDLAPGYRILSAAAGREPSSDKIVGLLTGRFTLPDLPKGLTPTDIEEIVKFLIQSETMTWKDVVAFRNRYGKPLRTWIQRVRQANQRPLPEIAKDLFRQVQEDTSKATTTLVSATSGLAGLLLGGAAGGGIGAGIGYALGIVIARRYGTKIGPVFAKLTEPRTDTFLLDTAAWKARTWR